MEKAEAPGYRAIKTEEQEEGFDIRKYWRLFLKRKNPILIVILVSFVGVSIYLKRVEPPFVPMYNSTCIIRLKPRLVREHGRIKYDYQSVNPEVYARALSTEHIADMASAVIKEKYDSEVSTLEISRSLEIEPGKEDMLTLSCSSSSPHKTLYIVEGIIEAYKKDKLAKMKELVDRAHETIKEQLVKISRDLEKAKLGLSEFVLNNTALSEAIRLGEIGMDVNQISVKHLELRAKRTDRQAVLDNLIKARAQLGDIEAFKFAVNEYPKLVNEKLLNVLDEKQEELDVLLLSVREMHPDVIQAKEDLNKTKQRISGELNNLIKILKNQIDSIEEDEKRLKSLIEMGLGETMIEYRKLERNIDLNEKLYQEFLDGLQAVKVWDELINVEEFTILQPAKLPSEPYNLPAKGKRLLKLLVFSLVIALGLGGGTGLLLEYLDVSVKGIEEVEKLVDWNMLGNIPYIKAEERSKSGVISIEDPKSSTAEGFRCLRTNLKFASTDKDIKAIVITSSIPKDGKSFVAANLGAIIANAGEAVLVLDADMRKPRIHTVFDKENQIGLSTALSENIEPPIIATDIPHLSIITSGKIPPNPSELLSSERFDKLLSTLRDRFKWIIIDSPPLLSVTDPSILIKKTDAVIITIGANKTPKKAIARATQMLNNLKANVIGFVINKTLIREGKYTYSYYYHYYGRE